LDGGILILVKQLLNPMIFELSKVDSIANHFLAELRDTEIQKDSMRFRRNLERVGELLAYELSKTLDYTEKLIQTPLGKAPVKLIENNLVLITILRAGIPFFQGFLNIFDQAESGFVGAFRKSEDVIDGVEIEMGYVTSPSLENKSLLIIDPMLATGKSLIKTVNGLKDRGTPSCIHVVSAIASRAGIEFVKKNLSLDFNLWTGVIDEHLNENFYIVPGLGDAGDLSYGPKL